MSGLLPLLPELLEAPASRREHFRRVGLLPHRPATTVLELLEPPGEVSAGWAGSRDPQQLRRFLQAHGTCEQLGEQVGVYSATAEPTSVIEGVVRAA